VKGTLERKMETLDRAVLSRIFSFLSSDRDLLSSSHACRSWYASSEGDLFDILRDRIVERIDKHCSEGRALLVRATLHVTEVVSSRWIKAVLLPLRAFSPYIWGTRSACRGLEETLRSLLNRLLARPFLTTDGHTHAPLSEGYTSRNNRVDTHLFHAIVAAVAFIGDETCLRSLITTDAARLNAREHVGYAYLSHSLPPDTLFSILNLSRYVRDRTRRMWEVMAGDLDALRASGGLREEDGILSVKYGQDHITRALFDTGMHDLSVLNELARRGRMDLIMERYKHSNKAAVILCIQHGACWGGHGDVLAWMKNEMASLLVPVASCVSSGACRGEHRDAMERVKNEMASLLDPVASRALSGACRGGHMREAMGIMERATFPIDVTATAMETLYGRHMETIMWLLSLDRSSHKVVLATAIDLGFYELVSAILGLGVVDADVALGYAYCSHDERMVELIIKEGKVDIDRAVRLAADASNVSMVSMLLKRGAKETLEVKKVMRLATR
jgi:hypothetical protein